MLTVRRTPRRRVAVPALLGSLESVTALVLAHVAAGGEVPALWWLCVVGLLVHGAGALVLHRRASIRVVLPVLVAVQLLGHAWLVALSPGMHGHEHAMTAFLGLTPAMLGAHLLAAVVTGTMWSLRRRAVEVLLAWTEPGRLPAPRLRPQRVVLVAPAPARRGHRALAPTRGPPAAVTVALV
ncbi:hypothetical protein ACIRN4_19110 [Pimelobacter simplex]|uniref:hypothetical protein n=1 Tax=Nocardioides simplex TaxID=2045 RepID=UPI0037F6C436